MKKGIFFLAFALLFSLSLVSAVCTVTFDKTFPDSYNPSSTITATKSCSEVTEKNTAYTLTWTNETGSTLEIDLGTTPNSVGVSFFNTYIITSAYSGNITATLTGTDLEGSAVANVSGSDTNSLIIKEPTISDEGEYNYGKILGILILVIIVVWFIIWLFKKKEEDEKDILEDLN